MVVGTYGFRFRRREYLGSGLRRTEQSLAADASIAYFTR